MSANSPLRNEQFDTGSNYNFYEKMLKTGIPRSLFDLSHLVTTTIDNAGKVIPLSVIPTLPGDDFDISVTALLRVMPQVVPLYSRQRLYIYAFWSRNSDLWCNWQTFTKRGLSGNKILHTPQVPNFVVYNGDGTTNSVKPGSLGDMLGLPIGFSQYSFDNLHVNALPAMMYLRIWRDYFCDPNYFLSDEIIFPDDDSRFRLDNDGNLLSAKDLGDYTLYFDLYGNYDNIFYRTTDDDDFGEYSDTYDSTYNNLVVSLFYHDFAPDRFTTALPFAQRGDISRATITLSGSVAGQIPALDVDFSNKTVSGMTYAIVGNDASGTASAWINQGNSGLTPLGHFDGRPEQDPATINNWSLMDSMLSNLSVTGVKTTAKDVTLATSGLTFNIDDLRQIIIAESEMEKMARTDGSYGQFVETFFNVHPKSAYDYRPVFVGGTHQNLLFSEVLQQSSTDSTSPLGSYAGHGISGAGDNGYLGHLKSDDYGYLMILACVMPDVYYSQGLDKHWTTELQTDLYLPERSEIGLQPVYNFELYATAGNVNGLFGYNDPFDEFRYMPNRIHGKIADPRNESFYPYTQSRHFSGIPTLGRDFSEARQVRKDYLAASSEAAYSAQFDINIRAVRPLPYKSTPALFV